MKSASDANFFTSWCFGNINDVGIFLCETNLRIAFRFVQCQISEQMSTNIIGIFYEFTQLRLFCLVLCQSLCFLCFALSFLVSLFTLLAFSIFLLSSIGIRIIRSWSWFLLLLLILLFRLLSLRLLFLFWCWLSFISYLYSPGEMRSKTIPRECVWVSRHIRGIVA